MKGKRIISLLLAVVLCIGLLPLTANAASTYTYGDLTYTINNGEITITDCKSTATTVVIPAEIDGFPVTRIGENAFSGCSSLTSITIPDSVIIIDHYTFFGCKSLTDITIPDSVTSIGVDAFYGCTSLVSVTIPKSVRNIGERVFAEDTALTHFVVDEENPYFSTDDAGVLFDYNKTTLVCMPGGYSGAYTIPSSVNKIKAYAFQACRSLTSVIISEGVTNIKYYTFLDCTSLKNVTLPNSIVSIGVGAFQNCASLTSMKIPKKM